MNHAHCCEPEPPIPDQQDLADTFCFLREHRHQAKRSCRESRIEASAVVKCLRLLHDEHEATRLGLDEASVARAFAP